MSAKTVKKPNGLEMSNENIHNPVVSTQPNSRPGTAVGKIDENAPKTTPESDQADNELIESYKKRLEMLPLPADVLKQGLSEIGSSPNQLKSVFRKLSLPVSKRMYNNSLKI
jgi:hypothetical protein